MPPKFDPNEVKVGKSIKRLYCFVQNIFIDREHFSSNTNLRYFAFPALKCLTIGLLRPRHLFHHCRQSSHRVISVPASRRW